MLPPPESSKSRHSKPLKPPEESIVQSTIETVTNESTNNKSLEDVSWLNASNIAKLEEASKNENNNALPNLSGISADESTQEDSILQPTITSSAKPLHYSADAFSDLDPLGTGKIRPYIDKKYFFQELKNPPKKVLKELSDRDGSFSAIFSTNGNISAADLAKFDDNSGTQQPNETNSRKNSDQNDSSVNSTEFVAQFATSTQIFSPNNNGTHGTPPTLLRSANDVFKIDTIKTEDPVIGNNRSLLVTDNDPFSPRMKKFDPFDDDFSKKSINTFEFNFSKGNKKSTILPDTRIVNEDKRKQVDVDGVFNGPLQVSLPPPENVSTYVSSRRIEKQTSEASDSSLRSRPNVIKQNTVDALSSISTKKIKPHIFSQKLTKRDSNMRRLQESDSFSENETAPEPPPRPDTNSYSEPPPLPPKKQFSDIVIRPRVTSPLVMNRDSAKYDYLGANKSNHSNYDQQSAENTPSLPLPSRRIGRTESSYPGPGRPEKKREDDYLTPITAKMDLPILLPPPKTRGSIKNRNRRQESSSSQNLSDTSKKESDINENTNPTSIANALPDITLTQLLTLGIEDLALRLNVPSTKLSTMTIVELTKYLSDFIEETSQKSLSIANEPIDSVPSVPASSATQAQQSSVITLATATTKSSTTAPPPLKTANESSAVFKVSFDDSNDATFIAKFDDNFGMDNDDFTPNFDHFNQTHNSAVDKYAVFREIIDQDLQSDVQQTTDTKPSDGSVEASSDAESPINEKEIVVTATTVLPKIDTKITQAISQAKDRYAALRDIILVEDLFEKPAINVSPHDAGDQAIAENVDNSINEDIEKEFDEAGQSSPDVNISINLEDHDDTDPLKTITTPTISQPILGSKDDLEIDEYMNRAISNLSLDSRDHLSPLSKSPAVKSQNASTSPLQRKSPLSENKMSLETKTSLNDMSTSPIPIQGTSPIAKQVIIESPASTSMASIKSPMPLLNEDKSPNQVRSLTPADSQVIILADAEQKTPSEQNNGNFYPFCCCMFFKCKFYVYTFFTIISGQAQEESWAVFDTDKIKPKDATNAKSPKGKRNHLICETFNQKHRLLKVTTN